MRQFLRDMWVVGRNELAESVRSRRALVVLILYLAGSVLTCNIIVSVIHKAENSISKALQLPPSTSAGVVTDALWEHRPFRHAMVEVIGDRRVAMELFEVPPMAMIFSALAFFFTPMLVMLTSSTRISEELSTGSIRFVAVRTSRAAWCLGKYIGQALVLVVVLQLAAIGAWCVFRLRLADLDSLAMAQAMAVYAWKVWLYSLAYIGLALGVSQMTKSPNKAMSVGFLIWFVMAIVQSIASWQLKDDGSSLWMFADMLTPMGHSLDMWRLDTAHQLQGAFFLLALGFSYFFGGYLFFARKDI
ncbi:hypothetical protein BVX97_03845 [bacterium E08(2017)]|nr:hypothetical protein BVX97_03845 [bacterium E08(2017)]